ncbi:hypothetical protein HY413_00320 [Candidatus Kaiserbacteria bacterium]|nr:hypothetical protein [Candidatus Kaiserbacteria bacterium]
MDRKVFLVVLIGSTLWTQIALADIRQLSDSECAELHRTNPSLPCVGTDADIAALQLNSTPQGFLEGRACKNTSLGCLDPQFAVTVQRFLMAAEEAGKQQGWQIPHLTDGWRSSAAQAAALASGASGVGPCGSPHNYGLAVDFNDPELTHGLSPAMKWMRANAHLYGLETIGRPSDGRLSNGKYDPAHFQIQGWQNRSAARGQCITQCNAPPSGKIQSCTGGGSPGGVMSTISNGVSDALSRITQPLSNLFRSEPAQPPSRPVLPTIDTGIKDVLSSTTPTFPSAATTTVPYAPASFTTPGQQRPQTPEETLAEIAVGPRPTTATTPQRPLTAAEIQFLREQQARLITETTNDVLENPTGLQPLPVSPFAGFIPTENLNQPASDEFLRYYVQILTRVALAIAEILRVMRGEPAFDPNSPETWFTE